MKKKAYIKADEAETGLGRFKGLEVRIGEIVDDEDVTEFIPGDQIWVPRKSDRNYWELFRQTMSVAAQIATVYLVVETARSR